jgi:hypothetical protein
MPGLLRMISMMGKLSSSFTAALVLATATATIVGEGTLSSSFTAALAFVLALAAAAIVGENKTKPSISQQRKGSW